ncbi:MAG: hypothetical protein FJ293_06140 [Planctomycetes bacterium]|nr:hypothetical protein [Planctomycetota bacterium]
MTPFACALLAATTALAPSAAVRPAASAPHHDTDSYAHVVVGASEVRLALELDTDGFMAEVEALPPQGEDWAAVDVEPLLERAADWVAERWALTLDGVPVELAPRGFDLLKAFDPMAQQERHLRIVLHYTFAAPTAAAAATLVQRLFEGRELAHRHTLLLERATADGGTKGGAPELLEEWRTARGRPFHFTLPDCAPGAGARRAWSAARAGVRSLLAAPWLPLFLLALALAPLAARERIGAFAATGGALLLAFAAARADWLAPAPWAALAAAALSVGYVAAENLFAAELKLRAATAALFGVVHGMALAPLADAADRAGRDDRLATGAAFVAPALLGALLIGSAGLLVEPTPRQRPALVRLVALLLMAVSLVGVVLAVNDRP